jgi:zinc transport system substrate-binding protein
VRRLWLLVGVALVALALPACSSTPDDGRLQVVASFSPVAEAARIVGGEHVDVVDLTPPGVEPHDFELGPDDVEAIATADVVLYLGGGFQPAVEEALIDAEGTVVDVRQGIATIPPPPGESAADVTADPHVWLDPERYSVMVGTIAEAFARADPQHARGYLNRARTFTAALATLDHDFAAGLANCERDTIVTSHAAFGYLAAAYGLRQEPITGLSPEAEPDARRLAELRALVEREGVTTIFTEELLPPEVAETLANEAGVTTAVLNPLETLTESQIEAGAGYVSIMRQNLEILRSALGCA